MHFAQTIMQAFRVSMAEGDAVRWNGAYSISNLQCMKIMHFSSGQQLEMQAVLN